MRDHGGLRGDWLQALCLIFSQRENNIHVAKGATHIDISILQASFVMCGKEGIPLQRSNAPNFAACLNKQPAITSVLLGDGWTICMLILNQ